VLQGNRHIQMVLKEVRDRGNHELVDLLAQLESDTASPNEYFGDEQELSNDDLDLPDI
jgi:hypothetical protein